MYNKDHKMGHTLDICLRASILLICLGYIVLAFPGYAPLPELTAQVNAQVLNTVGVPSISSERYVVVSFSQADRIYELSSECSGLLVYMMFLIGIAVVPHFSAYNRLFALLFLPILFLGNALRILTGIIVGFQFSVDASEFFHATFGQVLIFFWVLVCFILWLKLTRNFPKEE
jgi:exosortase/archaeosortase family protein